MILRRASVCLLVLALPPGARSADEVKPRSQKRLRERDRDKGEGRRELPAANVAEFKK